LSHLADPRPGSLTVTAGFDIVRQPERNGAGGAIHCPAGRHLSELLTGFLQQHLTDYHKDGNEYGPGKRG